MTFLLFPSSASAVSEACKDAVTQVDMNACSYAHYKEVDGELNYIYKKALAYLEEDEEAFRENQRVWIQYRDLTCHFQTRGKEEGGTIWPLIYNSCMARLTEQRSEEIYNIFMDNTLRQYKEVYNLDKEKAE